MKIIGLANNYKGMPEEDKEPLIFWKGDESTYNSSGLIIIPKEFNLVWPEVELAVIKTIHGIKYGVANDVTADSLEGRNVHLAKSKSLQGFCPISRKWRDFYNPNSILTLSVNGEVIQKDSLNNIRYTPEKAIEVVDRLFGFYIGDIIIMGTPPHPYYNLKDGDVVHARISSIDSIISNIIRK
jgi:2-keto-4-pentenoate hydratase/2-oxohepta-3-ene-1,7-dioic acid hydratase in catechol pathway